MEFQIMEINQINQFAQPEGWAIFSCEGSLDGSFQIQRLDSEAIFKGDHEAHKHVVRLALQGSHLHKEALKLILELNPLEAQIIIKSISI
jgi:hypothetical protein